MSVEPTVVVRTPDELLAALPHMLGFAPRESAILVPLSDGLPLARVDMPRTEAGRDRVLVGLSGPYGRAAGPGARVAVVCLTEDRRDAELTSRRLAAGLEAVGVAAPVRVWATEDAWVELNTGEAGARTRQASTRIAVEAVVAGLARPAATRQALADSLTGDRDPVAGELPAAWAAVSSSSTTVERDWAVGRLEQFHANGNRLSDRDAARLLVGLESTTVRDALWEDMSRDNAISHVALWTDLTRRAPDQVRAPAASMLAFSSWLKGDGVRAWCALDQIPDGPPYTMAVLVAAVLQEGVPPARWDRPRAAGAATEAYDAPPPGRRRPRDLPIGPRVGPPAPGRGAPGR